MHTMSHLLLPCQTALLATKISPATSQKSHRRYEVVYIKLSCLHLATKRQQVFCQVSVDVIVLRW